MTEGIGALPSLPNSPQLPLSPLSSSSRPGSFSLPRQTAAATSDHLLDSSAVASPMVQRRSSSTTSGNIRPKRDTPKDIADIPLDRLTEIEFDLEKYLLSNEVQKDRLRALVEIPVDDISVKVTKKESITVTPTHSEVENIAGELTSAGGGALYQWIEDCLSFFRDDFLTVIHKSEKLGKGITYGKTDIESLPKFQIDLSLCPGSHRSIPVTPSSISTTTTTTAANSSQEQNEDPLLNDHVEGDPKLFKWSERRQTIFNIFAAPDFFGRNNSEKQQQSTTTAIPFGSTVPTKQFVIELKEIVFESGEQFEPLFGTLCVYDSAKGTKCCEDFHFEVNPARSGSLLHVHRAPIPCAFTSSRKAFITISNPSTEMVFVISISKVLQGELDEVLEPYHKIKDFPALEKQAKEICDRLGLFRQVICWGIQPIFLDVSAETRCSVMNGERSFSPFYKHSTSDTPFLTTLLDGFAKEHSGLPKKMKTIAGRCNFIVTEITQSSAPLSGRVTPSLLPVKPFPDDTLDKYLVIRDVEEFSERRNAHLEYVNNLYVNLHSANLSKSNGRNIVIKIQLMESEKAGPVLAMFDNNSLEPLSKFCFSSVSYHNKTPTWNEEFKIKLPPRLTQSHHLLFTFYHVNCQLKKKDLALTSPVGYVVLPLLSNSNAISYGDFNLPIAAELPQDYMTSESDDKMKYLDNKKPLFRFSLRVISTVYPTDKNLAKFFQVQRSLTSTTDDLEKALQRLFRVDVNSLVQWFPIILRQLFRIMCRIPKLSAEAFATFIDILSDLQEGLPAANFMEITEQCIQYLAFNMMTSKDSAAIAEVYEEICKNWLNALNGSSECDPDATNKFAGFLFSLMYKSMVLKLWDEKKLDDKKIRASGFQDDWFPQKYITNLARLLIHLRSDAAKTPKIAKVAALFLSDLLSIMNRGRVLGMVKVFVTKMVPEFDGFVVDSKCEILRILCEYEHYIALNLPTKDTIPGASTKIHSAEIPASPTTTTIEEEKGKQHFMSELLLFVVNKCMGHIDRKIRVKALLTLRDVFIKHDMDERYSGKLAIKRICNLYAGFLNSATSNVAAFMSSEDEEERRTFSICVLWILKNMGKHSLKAWFQEQTTRDLEQFFDVLKICISCFHSPHNSPTAIANDFYSNETTSPLTPHGSQTMEDHVLTPTSPSPNNSLGNTSPLPAVLIGQYNSASPPPRNVSGMIKPQTTQELQQQQKQSDPTKVIQETFARSPRSGRSFRSLREKKTAIRTDILTVFERKPSVTNLPWPHSLNETIEKNMMTEAALIVLDVVQLFVKEMQDELQDISTSPNVLLDQVVRVYVDLLGLNQSAMFFQHLYSCLRMFTKSFMKQVVEQKTFYCGDFCRMAIRHANNNDETIRQEAAAFLYLLLRYNYELTSQEHIKRVKVQMTIGLSKLAGGEGVKTSVNLQRAFSSITRYCKLQYPSEQGKEEPKINVLVGELLKRLSSILFDSVKINRFSKDQEMTADLYHRIANSYMNTPDLRFTWLNHLMKKQQEWGNKTEAAMCVIHMAAFVSEFLAANGRKEHATQEEKDALKALPSGCHAFLTVAPNSNEEEGVQNQTHKDEEGCTESELTESGLLSLLNKASSILFEAELYELQNECYKLIIPILEKQRKYEDLRAAHLTLASAFEKIIEANVGGNRLLGSYYRVGLFGSPLEEMNGTEWIYREPKLALLPEVKNRIIKQFQDCYGPDIKVDVIQDSGNIVDSAIKDDPKGIHVQITKVEPYFTAEELEKRPMYADRNFNIDRFIFEQPFTLSGQKQSQSVADQWMRKVILTVKHKFPYTKKRILVISREEKVLKPIEVSIAAIEARTERLRGALRNPDPKMLQPILQGSCAVTVNQGPIEICRAFLPVLTVSTLQSKLQDELNVGVQSSSPSPPPTDQQPPELVERLREDVKEFLKACSLGLKVNSKIISSDQSGFQAELTAGFMKLAEDVGPFLGAPARKRALSKPSEFSSSTSHIPTISLAQAQAQAAAAAAMDNSAPSKESSVPLSSSSSSNSSLANV